MKVRILTTKSIVYVIVERHEQRNTYKKLKEHRDSVNILLDRVEEFEKCVNIVENKYKCMRDKGININIKCIKSDKVVIQD